jgi:predicted nucleotidyltransferase
LPNNRVQHFNWNLDAGMVLNDMNVFMDNAVAQRRVQLREGLPQGMGVVHAPQEKKVIIMANEPDLWDKLLYAVNEIYEPTYAIVAGGAVRDYMLDENPKDIDIFVHYEGSREIPHIIELAEQLGWTDIQIKGNPDLYKGKSLTWMTVSGRYRGAPVDLCFTDAKSAEEIVAKFDWCICQQWYDGKDIHATKAAKFDIAKKQWTPVGEPDKITMEHFDRVNKRHGGKYKIPSTEPWYMKFAEKAKIK